jgi:hypothetical protein
LVVCISLCNSAGRLVHCDLTHYFTLSKQRVGCLRIRVSATCWGRREHWLRGGRRVCRMVGQASHSVQVDRMVLPPAQGLRWALEEEQHRACRMVDRASRSVQVDRMVLPAAKGLRWALEEEQHRACRMVDRASRSVQVDRMMLPPAQGLRWALEEEQHRACRMVDRASHSVQVDRMLLPLAQDPRWVLEGGLRRGGCIGWALGREPHWHWLAVRSRKEYGLSSSLGEKVCLVDCDESVV